MGAGAKFPFGYNLQAAVDSDHQIIVANSLHKNQSDQGALNSILDQIENNCGKQADTIMGDCGYNSLENLKDVTSRGADPLIPIATEYHETPIQTSEQISKGDFCMAKKELNLTTRRSDGYLGFRKIPVFCEDCEHQKECKLFKLKNFAILDDTDRLFFNKHLSKCRTEEFKEQYRFRKAIVEPVFGNIKNKGIRIYYRGNKSVKTWWTIVCMAHNLEKITGHTAKTA
jgi:transposase